LLFAPRDACCSSALPLRGKPWLAGEELPAIAPGILSGWLIETISFELQHGE